MTLRKKIILGSVVTTGIGALTVGVILSQVSRKKTYKVISNNSFAEAVNTLNEFMDIKVKDSSHDNEIKYSAGFANPIISFNKKLQKFTISFKKLFNLKHRKETDDSSYTDQEIKDNLVEIAAAIGIIRNYSGYHLTDIPYFSLTDMAMPSELLMNGVDSTGEYDYSKIKYKEKLKDDNINLPKNSYANDQAANYQLYGSLDFKLPKFDSKGNIIYTKTFGENYQTRVLINNKTGDLTPIADASSDQIRKAIVYQLVKFVWGADQFNMPVSFTSVSDKDLINDKTTASFSINNDQEVSYGSYSAVKGKSLELLKRILGFTKISGNSWSVKVVKASEIKTISEEDLKYFHKYDVNGRPMNVSSEKIAGSKYAYQITKKDYGIIVRGVAKTIENPVSIKASAISDILIDIKTNENKKLISAFSNHKNQNLTYDSKFTNQSEREKAISHNKNNSYAWFRKFDDKQEDPKKINESASLKRLRKKGYLIGNYDGAGPNQGNETYGYKYGYISNKILAYIGKIPVTKSIGELYRNMFAIHYNKDGLNEKIKSPITNDFLKKLDIKKLFEENDKEINYGFNPHPITSINHPYIMGTSNLGYSGFNLAINYLDTPKTQKRKTFTKTDFKNDIFKNSSSASDLDLLTKIFINANMYKDGSINTMIGSENIKVNVDGSYIIGTSWDKDFLKKVLDDASIPSKSYVIDNGFILINKSYNGNDNKEKQSEIINILKAIFTKKDVKFADISGKGSNAEIANEMSFDLTTINSAISNASTIMGQATFKKDFKIQNSDWIKSQDFDDPSRTKQDKFNRIYKEIFNRNPITVGETGNGNAVKKSSDPNIETDVSLAGLSEGLADTNFVNKEVKLTKHAENGLPLTAYIGSVVIPEITYDATTDKFEFSVVTRARDTMHENNPLKRYAPWLVGDTPDSKMESFIALIHLFDKLGIKYVLVFKTDVKNYTEAKAGEIKQRLNEWFGTANIHSINEEETESTYTYYVELKKGNYLAAMMKFIDKTYSSAIWTRIKGNINKLVAKINVEVQKGN